MRAEALDRAKQYRFRAEELRTISTSWIDRETRQILGRVANDYERMATYLEEHNPSELLRQDSPASCKN